MTQTDAIRATGRLVVCVLALAMTCSCGRSDGQRLCSNDADCADDERCVSSGGVLFGDRICVLDNPDEQEDAGEQDTGEQDDEDKGPPWLRDD